MISGSYGSVGSLEGFFFGGCLVLLDCMSKKMGLKLRWMMFVFLVWVVSVVVFV